MSDSAPAVAQGPRKGLFYGWYVVAAAIVGYALSYSVIAVMSFGTFVKPLEGNFGWSRGQISFGLTLIGIVSIFSFPMAGALVDRVGVRKVLLPSTVLFALTFASFYFITDSLWHFYLICLLLPIMGAGTAPLTYSRVIVNWFDRKRGLALGLGLSGVGLGTAVVPLIGSYTIEHYNFRFAYVAIGLLIVILALPLVAFLLRETPEEMGLRPDGESPGGTVAKTADSPGRGSPAVGFTVAEALREKRFWFMVGSFLLVGLTTSTVLIHLIPMMIDRGMSRIEAAGTFAYLATALAFGRLAAGYLMDRFFAPYVVMAFMFGPVAGLVFLALGATGWAAAVSAALVGIAIGAEFDVIGYFLSRYYGLRDFGQLYGYSYGAFKIGSSTGPLIMGIAYDRLGRYDEVLWIMAAVMLVGIVLVGLLGRFPELPVRETGTA